MTKQHAPGLDVQRDTQPGGEVLTLTVRGGKGLNVVGAHGLRQGAALIRQLAEEPAVRCVILRGPSPRAFIGGADLNELGSLTTETAEAFIRSIHEFCASLRDFPTPVIAQIQGYCLGAGLEIAAACDFRIGDTSGWYGMPEVRVGVPSVVEAALLPALIGWGRTRELLLRGHIIDAKEAERIGLLEHCVAPEALHDTVWGVVTDILAGAPGAIRGQKRLIRRWEDLSLPAAIEAGVDAFVGAYADGEPADYTARFFARRRAEQEHTGRD